MKKNKNDSKKIVLLKETIVKLDSFKLKRIIGGGTTQTQVLTQNCQSGYGHDTLFDTQNGGPSN